MIGSGKADAADGDRGRPLMWRAVAIVVAVAAAVAVVLVMAAWWWLLPTVSAGKAPTAGTLFDLVKLAFAVVAGLGGAVALVVAYRRQQVAEDADGRDAERLFHERFQKASEQLGHEAAAVRLAGVYAMASLADDWEAQRQTCIDVLCAYLRMHFNPEPPDDPEKLSTWHGEHQVRQTVVRVIAAHLRDGAPIHWHGHDLDFTGATFVDDSFVNVRFSAGMVSFRQTRFFGNTNFHRAIFSGAQVYFDNATFPEGYVSFASAIFGSGIASFTETHFAGAVVSFMGASMAGGEVSFGRARFTGGKVIFHGTEFTGSFQTDTMSVLPGPIPTFGTKFVAKPVDFLGAQFLGGIVDLSSPKLWQVPPEFDPGIAHGPPAGLVLPAQMTKDPTGAGSDGE